MELLKEFGLLAFLPRFNCLSVICRYHSNAMTSVGKLADVPDEAG